MDEIIINKAKLLDKLKENRAHHRALFEDALQGWKNQVIDALNQAIDDALSNKRFTTMINLPQPSDHTSDYDEIIEQVKWHEEDLISLDRVEFRQYILDEWRWSPDFSLSTSSYSTSSSRSSKS